MFYGLSDMLPRRAWARRVQHFEPEVPWFERADSRNSCHTRTETQRMVLPRLHIAAERAAVSSGLLTVRVGDCCVRSR
jgi:hypothetical protein